MARKEREGPIHVGALRSTSRENPFGGNELRYLQALIDGISTSRDIANHYGLKIGTVRQARETIIGKMIDMSFKNGKLMDPENTEEEALKRAVNLGIEKGFLIASETKQ